MANLAMQAATLGLVERVAHIEQEQSLIKQLTMQQIMAETVKRDNEKIEKTLKSEGKKIRERSQEDKNPLTQQESQHKQNLSEDENLDHEIIDPYAPALPEGILINIKV